MNFEIAYKFFVDGEYSNAKPSFTDVLEANLAIIIVAVIILIATIVGLYGIGMKIFGKEKAYKAIIPFYGFFKLFQAVELNPFLSIIVWVPVVGIIPLAIFNFMLPKAFGQKLEYQVLSIFFPTVVYCMFGFDVKYEYQYIKGKNIAFQKEFKTIMPEELTRDALTPAASVNGAAVAPKMTAKESEIARASAEAMEKTAEIRRQQEEEARKEAERKAAEEAAEKAKRQRPDEFDYDFGDKKEDDFGPESVSLNFKVQTIGGKFQSSTEEKPAEVKTPEPPKTPETPPTTQPS